MLDALNLREAQEYALSQVRNKATFSKLQGHYRSSAFVGRDFIIYECRGLSKRPVILNRLRVKDFESGYEYGSEALILNPHEAEGEWIGHIPQQLWDYPIYMGIPIDMRLYWQARRVGGEVKNTLLFGVDLYTEEVPSRFTNGAIYCDTPKRLQAQYPTIDLNLY